MKKYIPFALILFIPLYLLSQEERVTKENIEEKDQFLEAQIQMYTGRYDVAIEKLMELYRNDRNNATIAFELSRAHMANKDFESAELYAHAASRNGSDNVWIMMHYSTLMLEREKFDEASEGFKALVKLDPSDLSHIENLAKCLIRAGKEEEAIAEMDLWESEHFIHEPIVKLKFNLYQKNGKLPEAEKELIKLVETYPGDIRYMNNLATFLTQKGQNHKAVEWYKKILELDPNDVRANTAMLSLHTEKTDENHYLRSLLPLIARKDIDPDAKVLELIPYIEKLAAGHDDMLAASLVEVTEKLSLTHPDHPKTMAIYADALYLNGQNAEAINAYIKTLDKEKKIYEVWLQLLMLLAQEEDYNKLKKYSMSALDYFPNQAENYLYSGIALNASGQYTDAIDILKEGLMVAAGDEVKRTHIHTELAKSFLSVRDMKNAEIHIDHALDVSKGQSVKALEVRGDIFEANGDIDKAFLYWQKAVKLGAKGASLLKKLNQ